MTTNTGFREQDGRWIIDKDPRDSLYYGRDIATRFPGRTIASVSASGAVGVTAGSATFSGTVASVLVSGGTAGQTGSVALSCTLDDGQVTALTLYFRLVAG